MVAASNALMAANRMPTEPRALRVQVVGQASGGFAPLAARTGGNSTIIGLHALSATAELQEWVGCAARALMVASQTWSLPTASTARLDGQAYTVSA